ncbi:MAG: Gfo/Idh/MocA family oxidoreductase [Alphaproteobacteria bacterium]|jgi:predicted dehydrogenase|nr:Gfo/Idh/MocA family oxidoreductase [Alphaproteobacteria bacterium]MBU0804057.1 Gfo/Idh/MocA family oxidoreductase [Alphaproteobacteria bacterium]MBU0872646.1 Gfo/Idh/MocA family oxidoreductase [Alphaproteobacteria bacterium]MBU1403658.1 Gfo/Idh/MocA family oxidoreductase [Alphaproteobacteria bacterium]MBU1593685.1 Gfo/Idh/MocA family oxidoreductase [Alphaproteobacteria bacterium]
MARKLGVGIVGCGNISAAYFSLAPLFKGIKVTACADINPAAAKARAKEFGVRAEATVEDLMKAKDVDIVVNLTVPAVHYAISRQALDAGKHVYSEKPFVLDVKEGLDLKKRADKQGLRVGSAPDTFLGGAHQQARHLVDSGAVGRITGGTCHVMSHGMEHWHPNPDFFFLPGAGPILDLGPYYITNLIQLIGPVKRVTALTSTPSKERTIGNGPRLGEKVPVKTPTTIHAIMEFESGAVVTFNASWDVWQHGHSPMELYGEDGTLHVPDPNFFGGDLAMTKQDKPVKKLPKWQHPFGVPNQKHARGMMANYRTAGLADMALAIAEDRPHRCSLDMALHAIDVMTGILKSGETGKFVAMRTTCERPEALGAKQARAMLAKKA